MNTILLIEDNVIILNTNKEYLEMRGYTVCTAVTLGAGELILSERQIDLIVLDVMLPDGSGIDFCYKLRNKTGIPVLFLTCLEDDSSLVSGLKAGGDEYMTKPYSLTALSARIEALLRRVRLDKSDEESFTIGSMLINCGKRRVSLNGEDVQLKPKEFDLLLLLTRNMGKNFTAEEIYTLVWGQEAVDVRTVVVHISSLRKKLHSYDGVPLSLMTEQRKYYSLIWID